MEHIMRSTAIPTLSLGTLAGASAQQAGKMDFMPGDRVIFFDSLKNETIGEFPSKWDLVKGSIEVTEFEGGKTIAWASNQAVIKPLMREKTYLPEQFTLEFEDYFFYKGKRATT